MEMEYVNPTGLRLGSFIVTNFLDRGGMAEVYKAVHTTNQQLTAAVKIIFFNQSLNSDQQKKAKACEDFLLEAKTVKSFKHPHIIPVYGYGTLPDGRVYLIMPEAFGSLRPACGQRIPLVRVADWLTQMGGALHYAHERKLVHRDVKPGNMLIMPDSSLKLSDFGIIARTTTDLTSKRNFAGSVLYMAPEQIQEMPVRASDTYALGVCAFQWLTGILPFTGDNQYAIMNDHVRTTPPSLRSINPEIPERVEQIVLQALAKDPKLRFASTLEFTERFNEAVNLNTPIVVKILGNKEEEKRKQQQEFDARLQQAQTDFQQKRQALINELARKDQEVITTKAELETEQRLTKKQESQLDHLKSQLKEAEQAIAELQQAQVSLQKKETDLTQKLNEKDKAIGNKEEEKRKQQQEFETKLQQAQADFQQKREVLINELARKDQLVKSTKAELDAEQRLTKKQESQLANLKSQLEKLEMEIAELQQAQVNLPEHSPTDFESPLYPDDLQWAKKEVARQTLRPSTEPLRQPTPPAQKGTLTAEDYTRKGHELYEQKRYQEALEAYDQAIRLDPKFAWAHNSRGFALNGLCRCQEALEAYDQAIRLDPKLAMAHRNRVDALNKLGKYQEALEACDLAIRLDPKSPYAHSHRGDALKGLVRYQEALEAYDQAIRLDPKFEEAIKNRKVVLEKLGRNK